MIGLDEARSVHSDWAPRGKTRPAATNKQWRKTGRANRDAGITQAFNRRFAQVKVDRRPLGSAAGAAARQREQIQG